MNPLVQDLRSGALLETDAPPFENNPESTPPRETDKAGGAGEAFQVFGRTRWAGICLLSGIFATGLDLVIHTGLFPVEPNPLLSGGLPESALLRAATVLFALSLVMIACPAFKLSKETENQNCKEDTHEHCH